MAGPTDYDTIASRYGSGVDGRPWNALYERPATLSLLPDVKDKDVLDAGCGSGWYADWLVRHGARVIAVDASRRMVEQADQRLAGRARVVQADIGRLQDLIGDGTIDLVLSALVLHYLDELAPVFLEWARILKADGVVVFSTHHPIHPARLLEPGYLQAGLIEEKWDWLDETMRYYQRPLSELTEPLAAAGFVVERICEPVPGEAFRLEDPQGFDRLRRIPAFIFVRARKSRK